MFGEQWTGEDMVGGYHKLLSGTHMDWWKSQNIHHNSRSPNQNMKPEFPDKGQAYASRQLKV